MRGWIKLHRQLLGHTLWKKRRVFSKAEAWIDILLSANGIDGRQMIGMTTVEVPRGTMVISLRYLSARWKWSKNKTDRFLKWLKSETMVNLKPGRGWTHLTICNYEKYNAKRDTNGDTFGTPTNPPSGHQGDTFGTPSGQTKEREEGKERKEGEKVTPSPRSFSSLTFKVLGILQQDERLRKIQTEEFATFLATMVGKDQWHAAVAELVKVFARPGNDGFGEQYAKGVIRGFVKDRAEVERPTPKPSAAVGVEVPVGIHTEEERQEIEKDYEAQGIAVRWTGEAQPEDDKVPF